MKTAHTYFDKEFSTFLLQLEQNNSREWFKNNIDSYQKNVAAPFKNFILQILAAIEKSDKSIAISVDEAVFRINREIRFKKDKSPYKIYKSALISTLGRKSKASPAFYIEIGAEYIKLAFGCFKTSRGQLRKIELDIHLLDLLIHADLFIDKWGSQIVTTNSISFETYLSKDLLLSKELEPTILAYWELARPVIIGFRQLLTEESTV